MTPPLSSEHPMERVLIAGLFHETHTFLQGRTSSTDFEIMRGVELIESPGKGSPLAGAVETARRFGWDLIPAIDLRAMPGPRVADEVIETFWNSLSYSR
jgi:microcystin degradation protein MlrC